MWTMKIQETQLCLGPRGEVVMEFLPLKQLPAVRQGRRSHPVWKMRSKPTLGAVGQENVGRLSCEPLTTQRKDI